MSFEGQLEFRSLAANAALYEHVGGKRGVKLENETVVDLREKAKAYKIVGRWKMNKSELVAAIREAYDVIGKRSKKK